MKADISTTVKTTITYARKATWMCQTAVISSEHEAVREHARWEAARLVADLLTEAESLARFANLEDDYMLGEARKSAREVDRIIRDRYRAQKMENTEGRTEAEAAAFKAKAAELREKLEDLT